MGIGVDKLFGGTASKPKKSAKCSIRAFAVGCVEKYGKISVFREHGVYQVRGFDRNGRHVNRAFRTVTAARKAARGLRKGSGERY